MEKVIIHSQEMQQAKEIIFQTVRFLVETRMASCRDDIIRCLIGAGFDITAITGNSITICVPDEPYNTLTLESYLFSDQFQLQPVSP